MFKLNATSHMDPLAPVAATLWEGVARTQWGRYLSDIERASILQAAALAGVPGHAIEVGAEGGRWSRMLYERGWSLTCTDVDAKALHVCRQRVPNASCIQVHPDDDRLPVADESAKLMLCVEVAPVVNSEWFQAECERALESNGLIVGVFWNLISFRGLFCYLRSRLTGQSSPYYKSSYGAWRAKLQQRGFEFVREVGCCWFPFQRNSNSKLIPVLTNLERRLGLQKCVSFSPWVVFVARKTSVSPGAD